MDVGYGDKKRVHLEVASHSRDWRLIGCEDDGDNLFKPKLAGSAQSAAELLK